MSFAKCEWERDRYIDSLVDLYGHEDTGGYTRVRKEIAEFLAKLGKEFKATELDDAIKALSNRWDNG